MGIGQGVRTKGAWAVAVAWALVVLWLVPLEAQAVRKIDPGDAVSLAQDEGLLVVSFDTDVPVGSARFQKQGSVFTAGVLSSMPMGRTTQLFAVPAGRYQWGRINFRRTFYWRTYFDLTDDPEYAFDVAPGRITYAGDIVFRPHSARSATVHVANRSVPVLDWLEDQHAGIFPRYRFEYSGHFPDPFPAFYRDALARAGERPVDLDAGRAAPEPEDLPIPPDVLWKHPYVRDASLSPDGRFVVVETNQDGEKYTLELVDVESGVSQVLAESRSGFGTVQWESERILLADVATLPGHTLHAFRIGGRKGEIREIEMLKGPSDGSVVDLLPDRPGRLLYQARDSRGQLVVHEVSLDDQRSIAGFRRAKTRDRLNVGVPGDLAWFADGQGRLRVAMAVHDEDVVLMHGADGTFNEVLRYTGDEGFQPVRLSHDGMLIYGFSDEGRAQRDLVVFDTRTGRIASTVYSKPGIDLHSALFDARRKPIGARYYEDGRLVSDYFADGDARITAQLEGAFPGRAVASLARNSDGSIQLLWVDGSDMPPRLYYVDTNKKRAELLYDVMPHLSGRRFAQSRVLDLRTVDGLPLQALLTLPRGDGEHPVVVMPHGGPIGVADTMHFNRDVQFIASLGYAVLQVNFRGSDGFGRAFREAGHRQFGQGIEDDIEHALTAALDSYPLDPSRMCVLGMSYGGYSALVSALRWPERFKCVVSIAGVSDRLLAFTASDSARTQRGREQLLKLMGDPRTDMQALQEVSPLYRYEALTGPIMLIHGREDLRVDFEHTRRLVRMLNLAGRPPVVMAFPGEGHGLSNPAALDIAWTGIAGFLARHLRSEEAGTDDRRNASAP